MSSPTTGQKERRAFQRYDIKRGVHYRVMGIRLSGSGKTINLSRGGMLLAVDRILPRGMRVEVEVNWPVRLGDKVPVKLVVRGRIVRSEKNGVALAAVTIDGYEFHTVSDHSAVG